MKRTYLFLGILIFFASCRSIDRFQTNAYPRLAPNHKLIAILPIELSGQKFSKDVTDDSKLEFLKQESDEIQNSIYSYLLKSSGIQKNDIKIDIKAINNTNTILSKEGINIENVQSYSEQELALLLGVDAVLRTRVDSPILLSSKDGDLGKEIINVASIFTDLPFLNEVGVIDVATVSMRCELIDAAEGISIWAYERKRDLKLREKNTDLLYTLTRDICKNFPYRELR
jgi:hypothetical protein